MAEKVREKAQMQQKKNVCTKLMLDKRFRWWTMIATPFLVYYLIGVLFSSDLLLIIKILLLSSLYAICYFIGKKCFDDNLMSLLPLSVYMSTKLWFYVTWMTYIAPIVSVITTFLFLGLSGLLWICFWKSWRGDAGIIRPSQEQRFRVSRI